MVRCCRGGAGRRAGFAAAPTAAARPARAAAPTARAETQAAVDWNRTGLATAAVSKDPRGDNLAGPGGGVEAANSTTPRPALPRPHQVGRA